jgi:hypothetical protein
MDQILGGSFSGRERRDRARQGIYTLMDWIIDAATFSLEELFAEAEAQPLISNYRRPRQEVVLRLLDALVANNYLHRVENEFDVVWGRDISQESFDQASRLLVGHATVIASPSMPAGLRAVLVDALHRSGYFSSHEHLQSVFVDARLQPWRKSLPHGNSVAERIENTVDFLLQRRNDQGTSALVLFLRVLGEMIEAGDSLRQELASLTQEVEKAALGGAM